jgi:hypothetical protein
MPRRRRLVKGRLDRLTFEQETELLHGHTFFGEGFAKDDEAGKRAAWNAHRDLLMAKWEEYDRPGLRPWGWWQWDAPEPRDKKQHEALQLLRLGQIGTAELEELKANHWPLYERQARSAASATYFTPKESEAAYWAKRREYGIPDSWKPTAGDRPRALRLDGESDA